MVTLMSNRNGHSDLVYEKLVGGTGANFKNLLMANLKQWEQQNEC